MCLRKNVLTTSSRRWIRLLFGREFAFDDLLRLWDLLFAEDPALDLVDLVCVTMLLRIRWQCKSPEARTVPANQSQWLLQITQLR